MSTGWYITPQKMLSEQCQQDGTLQHTRCISTMSTGWYITAQRHDISTVSTGWYITAQAMLCQQDGTLQCKAMVSQQSQQDGTLQYKRCYLNNVNRMVHYSTNDAMSTG